MSAKPNKKQLYWRICGYDSSKQIFDRTVEHSQFTVRQMENLLMALTAKVGLDCDEIVGAYSTRKTKIANEHLAVHHDFQYPTLSCGSNPHFVASVVDEAGKITPHGKLS
jgi:hypothetical protein